MTQAFNPESGTVKYTYDLANNLLTRIDNRSIMTSYAYDALNRTTSVTYSDGTPTATYSYDPNVANGVGQLGSVSSSNSIATYTGYDAARDVLSSTQQTAGQSYGFSYQYNLAGGLLAETHPSGRVLTTGYDAVNRPVSLTGVYGSESKTYVQTAQYAPHGGPSYLRYGNHVAPVWTYNSRLQPSSIYATDNNNSSNYLWVQNYGWGTTGNNGTLQSLSEGYGSSVPWGSLSWFSQSYAYDAVNRLSSVTDTGYTRSFGYDRFGNMWVTANSGAPLAGNTPTSDVYNAANNEIGGGSYDQAGNQVAVNGNTLVYDAENRQTSATQPAALGGGTVQYFYDGGGRRVEKLLDGNLTIYVYDALGQLAAEYQSGNAQTAPCQTCYLLQDHLGSTRLVTDDMGGVMGRHDFLPFGEEIAGGTAGRSQEWGTADYVDQKFTGQVRDSETGEDFFNARYFTGALGRFNSPDPANAGADVMNPQTWNGYAYVNNNPLNATDPTGLCSTTDNPPCYSGGTAAKGDPDFATSTNPYDLFAWISDWIYSLQRLNSGGASAGGTGASGGSGTGTPPKSGTPILPQVQTCESSILNAVNDRFKSRFTTANVALMFRYSQGAPAGQGTLNLNFAVPASMQPTNVAVGRYPVNPATYVLGAGATLHIPPGPSGADSPLTLPFSPSQFTAHLDSALPYNPIGLLTHLLTDMTSLGGYKPCP